MEIDGGVAPGFEPVAAAFARNFDEHGEIGASVAVYHRGRLVADLAGGRDEVRDRPFTRETLMRVASCTKGATAICVLMLVEAGRLDLDAPVAEYWPEFGAAGKQAIPLRWLLGHRAGLPYPDPGSGLTGMDQLAGPALVRQLAAQAPWWPPGSAYAYHAVTYGTLLGEVVRRVTGDTLGAWFDANVARPLGLEFWIGLPAELDDRVAPGVWAAGHGAEPGGDPPPGSYAARRRAARAELPPLAPDPDDPASVRAYHGIEMPAANGIANARSLARMYAAVLDEGLLSPAMVAAAATSQTDGLPTPEPGDAAMRFGLGFQLASPAMPGLGPGSFGHSGAGGRLGLADPDLHVTFGYVCNSMRDIPEGGDPRWAPLLAAVRDCVA